MRLSYQWLGELVDGLPDAAEVARRLTAGGIEVEALIEPAQAWDDRLVVARIDAMEQHPNADRLTVCQVDDGTGALHAIVCGARNMKAGDTVVLARPGCRLPGGLQIKKSKLRGVESAGMLCSATELGLPPTDDGILVLEEGLAPGSEAAPLLGLDDTILELGITPNRGDCLSVLGLAREVAAVCGLRLREVEPGFEPSGDASPVSVEVETGGACLFYRGLVLENVKVAPSPTWLRTRLVACGLRPINNVVDVTNFVLMERGQPLHAFDLARLAGPRIVARPARLGETIRALDGRDVALRAEDNVIADAGGPVAIAGVMGGEASSVTDATTGLFLESAMFDASAVRRTSRHHGMISDSSYRFERGVDPAGVEPALLRAASLLMQLAGARPAGGLASAGSRPSPRPPVLVRSARVNALLGTDLADEKIEGILRAVGAGCSAVAGGFEVKAPSFRQDLGREIDFVEEVARVVGYDSIAPALPLVTMMPVSVPVAVRVAADLRSVLSGLGLHEHVSVSFSSEAANARFPGLHGEEPGVQVRNPLRADDTALQKSALPALLAALRANVAQQQPRVDLFAIARTFAMGLEGEARQREVVAGLLYGPRLEARMGSARELVFGDVKALVEKVIAVLAPGRRGDFVAVQGRPEFHPRAAAEVRIEGRSLGVLGRLHPDLSEELEITGEIYVFEVDCREAVAYRRAHSGLMPIPRFPSSERDISFLVHIDTPASAAIDAVEEMAEPSIESISVFDEYTGAGIGDGLKALGYRLVYRAADRTLTEAEVTALHEKVVGHLTGRLQAQVRV
ncbi:MAG: phenylalanine--tRNA ligase subunit beta [Candidatus Binatia bacterium]